MLFAELHSKLSADATDLERREDVLTSTVFGSLIVGEQWALLSDWLSRACDAVGNRLHLPTGSSVEYWFWPRLAEAEPDLVLLFGDVLVIVEAKYLSGKSNASPGEDAQADNSVDQLAREWRSCDPAHPHGASYPAGLRRAIEAGGNKRVLVYLVRQPASKRTRSELSASLRAIGDSAALYALGWSDLGAVLRERQSASSPQWIVGLLDLLERRGFKAFRGFSFLADTDFDLLHKAGNWQIRTSASTRHDVSFRKALRGISIDLVKRLATTGDGRKVHGE